MIEQEIFHTKKRIEVARDGSLTYVWVVYKETLKNVDIHHFDIRGIIPVIRIAKTDGYSVSRILFFFSTVLNNRNLVAEAAWWQRNNMRLKLWPEVQESIIVLDTPILPSIELPRWQRELNEELAGEPDKKKIIWYYDRDGDSGYEAYASCLEGTGTCIHFLNLKPRSEIANRVEDAVKNGWSQHLFLIDLREVRVRLPFYDRLEEVRNGTVGIKGKVVRWNSQFVVVFSRFYPAVDKLPPDRWDIRILTKNNDNDALTI